MALPPSAGAVQVARALVLLAVSARLEGASGAVDTGPGPIEVVVVTGGVVVAKPLAPEPGPVSATPPSHWDPAVVVVQVCTPVVVIWERTQPPPWICVARPTADGFTLAESAK